MGLNVAEQESRQGMRARTDAMATSDPPNNPKDPPDKQKLKPKAKAEGDTPSDATMQVQLQVHLGRTLEAVYRALVEEPVPDRLLRLLDLLDEQERKEAKRIQGNKSN